MWIRNDESGQNLVIVTLSMVALVAMLGLVLDGGWALAQRRRMQNAADAGALAGVRELALGSPDGVINSTIQNYAINLNGAGAVDAWYSPNGAEVGAGSIPTETTGITVTTTITFETFFAGIVGINEMTVSSRPAVANYGAIAAMMGLAPMAVPEPDDGEFDDGEYTIWDSDPDSCGDDCISNSNRGWLDFDGGGGGANELREWVENGYDGEIAASSDESETWIEGEPGTKASVSSWVQPEQTLLVPIYDETHVTHGNQLEYKITSFAAFKVTEVHTQGNQKYIKGEFDKMVEAGEWGGLIDHGVRTVKLTQ